MCGIQMSEKDEFDRLRDLKSKLGEFYTDYLILVRSETATCSITSDKTWSVGAAELYLNNTKNQQLIDRIDERMEDDE